MMEAAQQQRDDMERTMLAAQESEKEMGVAMEEANCAREKMRQERDSAIKSEAEMLVGKNAAHEAEDDMRLQMNAAKKAEAQVRLKRIYAAIELKQAKDFQNRLNIKETELLVLAELNAKQQVDTAYKAQKAAEGELMKFRRTLGIINGAMSSVQVPSLDETFNLVDQDHDGKIDHLEFSAAFGGDSTIDRMWEALETKY